MRRLIYISSSSMPAVGDELAQILRTSRTNNARAGLTGLLWTDGRRFLQALEGPEDALRSTYERIAGDPRHKALVVLADESISQRAFGDWSMGLIDDDDGRIEQLLATATPEIKGTFHGLIAARRAAA